MAGVEALREELEGLFGQLIFAPLERGKGFDPQLVDLSLVEGGIQEHVGEELEPLVE